MYFLNIIIILIIYNGIKCKEECNWRSIYLFHLSWTVVEKSESNGWFRIRKRKMERSILNNDDVD